MLEKPTKILIVEDEKIVALDIESILHRLGYCVVGTAGCGEEACRMASESAPDLVLMDIRIDGPLDGIETARRIHQASDVPVVFSYRIHR